MKQFLIGLMVLGLVGGTVVTAEAQGTNHQRVERTVEGSYGPYPAPVTGCNEPLGSFACLIVETQPTESLFTAKVTDAHRQPVFVQVKSAGERIAIFCGETDKPVTFRAGHSLEFHVGLSNWPGDLALDCPANRIKTTGTISVTLSNLP